MTEAFLENIEDQDDRRANPSLIQLRQLATVLKTTVADLVEPNIEERIINGLNDWIGAREAARFQGVSERDRKKILRRVLLRLIDSLEED